MTTGLFRVRSPLLAESLLMSFPPGTEMFQFPGFASPAYVFSWRYPIGVGCPIRISTDQSLLAAPRGFSQRATSFIASWCQGIHRMPFSCSRLPQPFEGRTRTHHAQEPSTHSLVQLMHIFICEHLMQAAGFELSNTHIVGRLRPHQPHSSPHTPLNVAAALVRQPGPLHPAYRSDLTTPYRMTAV